MKQQLEEQMIRITLFREILSWKIMEVSGPSVFRLSLSDVLAGARLDQRGRVLQAYETVW